MAFRKKEDDDDEFVSFIRENIIKKGRNERNKVKSTPKHSIDLG